MVELRLHDSFNELPQGYRDVLEAASQRSFFYSVAWFELLARTMLRHDERLVVAGLHDGHDAERPSAVFVGCDRPAQGLSGQRSRRGLTNFYSLQFDPMLAIEESGPTQVREMVRGLSGTGARFDVLQLEPLAAEHPHLQTMIDALRDEGYAVSSYFRFRNWYHPTAGCNARAYLASRPSRLRNTIERRSKKLARAGAVRFDLVDSHDGLDQAIAAYETVYAKSWKDPEEFPGFMADLARTCAALGALRLGSIYLDGVPIAAQLWIVWQGVATIYKLAHDEDYRELSAGTILTWHMMEAALDRDRVREVDFGSGDESYKREWMSKHRDRRAILACNTRSLRGGLAALRHIAPTALRRLWHGGRESRSEVPLD